MYLCKIALPIFFMSIFENTMLSNEFLILVAALLPVLIALYFINRKDKNNPEPTGQLVKALFFGVLSAPLSMLLSIPFKEMELYNEESTTVTGQLACAFFGAAIPEECFKFLMLWLVVRNNKYFDEHFDGIVYAVCIGMGFAGIENVLYLFDNYDNWVGVGIGRALLAIPGHFFFAIIMGYFYSLSHFTSSLVKRPMYLSFAILMPILAHGLYDGFLMVQSVLPDIACMLSLAVIFLLIRLRKISNKHIANLLRKDGVV